MKPKPNSPSFEPSRSESESETVSGPGSGRGSGRAPGTIDQAMRVDRIRLSRARQKLSQDEFARQLEASVVRRTERDAAKPRLDYPSELPISEYREQLCELIRNHQAIVVCGETGSGKSTQLPKICLEAGLGREAMIGHTQPRRLAARSIATRLAEEVATPLGELVGYKVRFGDQTGDKTLIKLMTDGILLAETQSDRLLDAYDAIIIDEAHERSLNIDFLLGYLKQLQTKRDDLKVIITSATIDAERFAEHFGDADGPAPIVSVEGRGYPVEIKYLPWEDVADDEHRHYDAATHVIAGIEATTRHGSGDVLVFLPTEREIREVSHRVAGHYKRMGLAGRVDLLPLYARLPQSEQQRIFRPDGSRRRIIFTTNVAESSLTVPGIHFVIDAGTARISRYSTRSKLQRLPIEPVSRASADQRAGRCGRIGPGVCVRLYDLEDYETREAYTTPEIRRTNLAAVLLQTKTLRLGELANFPLLDPPKPEAIRDGMRTLTELGAIDERHELTERGWKLGRLPVDPRVGRILLAADENGCLPEILPIAAALEIQDPRERPPEKRQAADESHSQFVDARSDFLSLLRLWKFYEEARSEQTRNRLERFLRKQFLSPSRMREWSDVYRQLREVVGSSLGRTEGHGVAKNDPRRGARGDGNTRTRNRIGAIRYEDDDSQIVSDDLYEKIHCSLLAGLLSGVAKLGDKNEYTGAGGLKLFLWPGSGVFGAKPKWIVASELVETSKQFARTVARVEPRWIEAVGAHLIKRSHNDPHWSSRAGGAFCYENQTLFGLPIVMRRRVPLPPIDPITARDLLIDHGLGEQQLRTNARFVHHNQSVIAAITDLAARTRSRDLVIEDYLVARFYQSRLPADVCDRGRLEKFDRALTVPAWAKEPWDAARISSWLEKSPAVDDSETPYLRPDDLLQSAAEISEDDFPKQLVVGQSELPLEYHFDPGSDRDGIQIKVHQAALSQLSADRLGWLVPGLLVPKLTAMIKSLPKRIRRNLVPAADVAAKIAEELMPSYGTIPFMTAVCRSMSQHAEMPVSVHDFQEEKMSEHLEFLVTVVDDDGETLGEGRQLAPLQREFASGKSDQAASVASNEDTAEWSRSRTQSFDFDTLPREVVRELGGVRVAQYPSLVDLGDAVGTQLCSDLASAETGLKRGLTRLYAICEKKEIRGQIRHLPRMEEAKIKLAGTVAASEIDAALTDLLARIAFVENQPVVRSREAFEARRTDRGQRIAIATQELSRWFIELADARFEVRREMESAKGSGRRMRAVADIDYQLEWLFDEGFLAFTPWHWLRHFPRYLKAMAYRLDRAGGANSRDDQSMQVIGQLWLRWLHQIPENQQFARDQAEAEFRWMVEELRVSLFAQPLGTSVKVSPQRCEKLLK